MKSGQSVVTLVDDQLANRLRWLWLLGVSRIDVFYWQFDSSDGTHGDDYPAAPSAPRTRMDETHGISEHAGFL
jgi:hypothetical protein